MGIFSSVRGALLGCTVTAAGWFAAAVPAGATEASTDNANGQEPITLTFRCLILTPGIYWENVSVRDNHDAPMVVDINSAFVSERSTHYHGANPIQFFSNDERIGMATIPEEADDVLILFRPSLPDEVAQGAAPFVANVIDTAAFDFPSGSYLFINLTDRHVGALVGGVDQVIKPGDMGLLSLDFEENRNIEARFREEIDGQWVRSYQLAWYFRPTNRQIVILSQTANGSMSITSRQVRGWGEHE
jgi:hypothetical protein